MKERIRGIVWAAVAVASLAAHLSGCGIAGTLLVENDSYIIRLRNSIEGVPFGQDVVRPSRSAHPIDAKAVKAILEKVMGKESGLVPASLADDLAVSLSKIGFTDRYVHLYTRFGNEHAYVWGFVEGERILVRVSDLTASEPGVGASLLRGQSNILEVDLRKNTTFYDLKGSPASL